MKRMMAASFCFVVTPFMCDCAAVTSARNYTFYMFYTDNKSCKP